MKRLWIALAVAALAVASVWLWAPKDVVQGNSAPTQTTVAAAAAPSSGASARSLRADPEVARVVTKRRVDAKQRDAYLRRIADGAARREHSSRKDEHEPSFRGQPAPASAVKELTAAGDRKAYPIKDRSGGELSDLVDAVGGDLLPLIDECYEAAAERDPSLAGKFDINIEMVGDEDVGGIVESFGLGEENEIHDEEMIECIRETTLSTIFPPPKDTGRRGVRLSMTFGPDAESAE